MAKRPETIPNLDEDALNVFTDGSMFAAPRRGGYGIVFVYVGDDGHELTYEIDRPGHRDASVNEMEVTACLEALRACAASWFPIDVTRYRKLVVWTDSKYLANGYEAMRYGTWAGNEWMTRDGNPVQHVPLWKELVRAAHHSGMKVEIVWRRGHSATNPHNKTADRIARGSARNALNPPVSVTKVRRKWTSRRVEPGCVTMGGQLMTIRVVVDKLLMPQRMFHVTYEVLSPRSPFRGYADKIYSDELLSAGRIYIVRVNNNQEAPRVRMVCRELAFSKAAYLGLLDRLTRNRATLNLDDPEPHARGDAR